MSKRVVNNMTIFLQAFVLAFFLLGSSVAYAAVTIDYCIDSAVLNDQRILAIQKNMQAAQFKQKEKQYAYLPSLGLTSGYIRSAQATSSRGIDDYSLSLILRQNLYSGGRLDGEKQIADIELKKAESLYNKTRKDIVLDVQKAYYSARYAQDVLEAKQNIRDNLKAYYERAKKLNAMTNLPRLEDLLQIEVQLGNMQIETAVAKTDLQRSKAVLADLTYTDIKDEYLSSSLPRKEIPEINESNVPKDNYEFINSIYDEQIAEQNLIYSKSALLPSVNMSAYTGWQGATLPSMNNNAYFAIAFEMTLYDFGKSYSKTEQSRSIYEQRSLEREIKADKIVLELSNLKRDLATYLQNLDIAKQNMKNAQKSLKIYEDRSLSFTTNSRQLLDAQQSYLQSQMNYLGILRNYNITLIEICRIMGKDLI